MTKRSCNRVLCPAIPVKITFPDSSKEVITYMGLDNFATDCFINNELLDELNASYKDETVEVTTMGAINEAMKMKLVKDLRVSSIDGSANYKISYLYGRGPWPFDESNSPQLDDIADCPHLKDLPINFANKEKIGILVGMNEPGLLAVYETIMGPTNKPYATRHMMGWALNGCLAKRQIGVSKKKHRTKIKQPEDKNP